MTKNFPATPFFLKTESGKCFCLYHASHPGVSCRGAFVYIHPFAEEMNKSRRIVALQARRFSTMGFGVLQIDLSGCGDSCGEFKDADWNVWKQDVTSAIQWLKTRTSVPISLWGLRLGALLALDFVKYTCESIKNILLWQPVLNGETYLTQFLRLQLVNKILSGDSTNTTSMQAMRNAIAMHNTIEIAGYELAPELATAINSLKMCDLIVTNTTVHWFEIIAEAGRTMTPASVKVVAAWKKETNKLNTHLVPCLPFWATQEITECPELINATSKLFTRMA